MGFRLSDLDPSRAVKKIHREVKRVNKQLTAPLRTDPLFRKITTGHAGKPSQYIDSAIHELYQGDPLAQRVGVKEEHAVQAAKVAAAAAAIYFSAGAATGYIGGGSAGAGAGATGVKTATALKYAAGGVAAASQVYGITETNKAMKAINDALLADQARYDAMLTEEPIAIPTPSDEALKLQRKRNAAATTSRRRGRAASILSDASRQPLGA